MLMAADMLKSLSKMEDEENYKRDNDDYDFGEVLKFYADDPENEMSSIYAPKRNPSFDN